MYMPGFGGGVGSPELNVNPQLIRGLITQMRAFREGRGGLEFHLEVVSEWARVGEVAQCGYCESRCVQTGLGSVLLHWERHRELPSVLPRSPRVVSGRECDPPFCLVVHVLLSLRRGRG